MPRGGSTIASLSDYIDYNLRCLSIGLNPSIISTQQGFYFANPRNRFWAAFNQAKVVGEEVSPSKKIHSFLLAEKAMGFTDVVKRASRMGHELRAADFRRDAPKLRKKVEQYNPALLWFHGKVAVGKFLQYAYGTKITVDWGMNELASLDRPIFVTPNPSPANAAFSLAVLVEYYRELAAIYR